MKINSIEKESVTYYSFEDICMYCDVNHDIREWSKIKNKDFSYTDEDKKRYISKKGIYQFLLLGFNINGYEKIFDYFEDINVEDIETKNEEEKKISLAKLKQELEEKLNRINKDIALILGG